MTNKPKPLKISTSFIVHLVSFFSSTLADCVNGPLDIPDAEALVNENARPPYKVGDSFTYTCSDPFQSVSPQITVCQIQNGKHVWSLDNALPPCKRTRCHPPAPILKGTYLPVKNTYEVGETVSYQCVSGYATKDEYMSVCRASGGSFTWELDKQLPQCIRVCKDPDSVDNAVAIGPDPPYYPGAVMKYQCKFFLFIIETEATILCQGDGSWNRSRTFGNLPKCYCSNPPLLFHGVFYPDPPHLPGADIHYSCDAQYAATNPGATIKCKSTGDWEINEFPSCIFVSTTPSFRKLNCLNCLWGDNAHCYYASNNGDNLPASVCPETENYVYCTSVFLLMNDNVVRVRRGCEEHHQYRPPSAPPPYDDCHQLQEGTIECSFNCVSNRCNLVSANDLRLCGLCRGNSFCNYRTGLCRCVSGYAGENCETNLQRQSNLSVVVENRSSAKGLFLNFYCLIACFVAAVAFKTK